MRTRGGRESGLLPVVGRAVLRGARCGAVAGAVYATAVGTLVVLVSLLLDEDAGGPRGAELVSALLSLFVFSGVLAALLGAGIGAGAGALLQGVLVLAVRPVADALQRAGLGPAREPLAAGLLGVATGLLVLPRRLVDNTTLLLTGPTDDALQLVLGKLLPAALLTLAAVREQRSRPAGAPPCSRRGPDESSR